MVKIKKHISGIRQRADGKFDVNTSRNICGKRVAIQKKGFDTLEKAEVFLMKYLDALKKNIKYDYSIYSLDALFEEYKNNFTNKPSTLHKQVGHYSKWIRDYFKKYNDITMLTCEIIDDWHKKLFDNPYLGTSYKNDVINTFSLILNYGCESKELSDLLPIVLHLKNKKIKETEKPNEINILTDEEYNKFINVYNDKPMWKLFFLILYYTGIRLGEARAIRFNRIINKDGTYYLLIRDQINSKCGKKWNVVPPKSVSSNRNIPLTKKVIEEFEKYKKLCQVSNGQISDEAFLFSVKDGNKTPIGETTIRRKLEFGLKESNLKHIKIHAFRHMCTTRMVKKCDNILKLKQVSYLLGHKSTNITLDIYTRLNNNKTENVLAIIDD